MGVGSVALVSKKESPKENLRLQYYIDPYFDVYFWSLVKRIDTENSVEIKKGKKKKKKKERKKTKRKKKKKKETNYENKKIHSKDVLICEWYTNV